MCTLLWRGWDGTKKERKSEWEVDGEREREREAKNGDYFWYVCTIERAAMPRAHIHRTVCGAFVSEWQIHFFVFHLFFSSFVVVAVVVAMFFVFNFYITTNTAQVLVFGPVPTTYAEAEINNIFPVPCVMTSASRARSRSLALLCVCVRVEVLRSQHPCGLKRTVYFILACWLVVCSLRDIMFI